ncbi:hypothetical protein ACP70R_006856 [Stipagrostis hirtigluma subsp. patula]
MREEEFKLAGGDDPEAGSALVKAFTDPVLKMKAKADTGFAEEGHESMWWTKGLQS